MRHYSFYHHHHAGRLAFGDFWLYELSMWLHTLAYSLVSVFIPVLMLASGYSVVGVLAYYLILNIFDLPSNFFARYLVARYGARVVIALATVSTILFFWILAGISSARWTELFALAFFAALYDGCYWVAHFYLFVKSSGSAREAGRSTGVLYAVRQAALLLGPVIGAALLVLGSEHSLLYVTIGLFALSLIPLYKMGSIADRPREKPLAFSKFFESPSARRPFASMVLYTIHDSVEQILFPLFIFTLFSTIQSVAIIPIILSLAQIILALGLGRLAPARRKLAVTAGAFSIVVLWAIRLALPSTFVYYGTVLLIGLCSYFVLVPLDTSLVEHARRVGDPLSAALYRNLSMTLNIPLYALLLLFASVFKPSFVFAAASLVCIGVLYLVPRYFEDTRMAML